MKTLLGKKVGMTQIFDQENGRMIPVTVVDVSNNVVSKHNKLKDQVTHIELGKDKATKSTKADQGNYKALAFVPRFKKMLKVENASEVFEIGTELKADVFAEGEYVDVTSTSKGKGFQGVMKRWGFKGGSRTHGQSDRERAPGSIGSGTTVGRVLKGLKMAGRMGRVQKTIQGLKVVNVDVENGLISLKGAVSGNKGSYIIINKSKKRGNK